MERWKLEQWQIAIGNKFQTFDLLLVILRAKPHQAISYLFRCPFSFLILTYGTQGQQKKNTN